MPRTKKHEPTGTDSTFDALHAIRVKGFAPTEVITTMVGLPEPQLTSTLTALQTGGLIVLKEGPINGWRLTESGTAEHAATLDRYRTNADMDGIEALHHDFTPLNARVKQLCTAWQLRDGAVNDHCDTNYDRRVIQEAAALQRNVDRTLETAEPAFVRVNWYRPRLADANRRFVDGDGAALARPLSNSYHDAWMELHQDLIVTLGLNAPTPTPEITDVHVLCDTSKARQEVLR